MPGLEGTEAESLARSALAAWGLEGATLTLASQSGNTVYRVRTAAGAFGNVVRIRPPLIIQRADVDAFLAAFDDTLREVDAGA